MKNRNLQRVKASFYMKPYLFANNQAFRPALGNVTSSTGCFHRLYLNLMLVKILRPLTQVKSAEGRNAAAGPMVKISEIV